MMSSRRWLGILSLFALAGSLFSCCTTQPITPVGSTGSGDCTSIGDHNIEVGAKVSCKWVFLHSNEHGQGNTVNWKATDQTMGIKISFDDASVFPGLNCSGSQKVCQSGALNPAYKGDPSVDYHYHAFLCAQMDPTKCGPEVDPGIIIVP